MAKKVKKVKAPKTYDPGKGRPKEHLAYLNKREMAYLRSINGNNMEQGPKGLPSFPPDDAVGSSSKSSPSSSSSSGLGGGNKTGVGGGGAGGGGATGSRGSSTGSVGSTSGSQAPGNTGTGGQRGPTSGSLASNSGNSYKGPSSPMGGQGPSFSRDSEAQQNAQVRDAIAAVKNSPSFRGDISLGGIRSINVGPMQTPVRVGGPISPMSGQGTSFSSPQRAADYNRKATLGNANSAAPKGMIGTPRGYVNAEQAAAVDKAMQPIAAVGQQLPYFAPGVGPIIGRVAGVVAGALPGVVKTVSSALTTARSAAEAAKAAAALKAAQQATATSKPFMTESQIRGALNRAETLAQARARAAAQPGAVQRGIERIDRGIDTVTSGIGVGTGDVARAKASGMIAGYGEGLRQGYGAYSDARAAQEAEQETENGKGDFGGYGADGKGDFGGYRAGGQVKRTDQKSVTAPKTYDPGKGRPKEHLAYLNEREMAYLRSINGNNMERGPKNLPSFPPDDALGSSSKTDTSSNLGGGNKTGVGGGGAGGGGSTGSRGSSTGSVGPGSGSQAPGNTGTGGQRGPTAGNPAANSSVSKGPASPMGGQGTSFSRDSIAQQNAQVKDAIDAVKRSPAFRGDVVSAGVRSINVGPMQTPVRVGGKVDLDKGFIAESISKVRPTTTPSQASPYKYDKPLTPGMTPEDMALRGALMNRYEQEIRELMREGVYTRTGDPISAGGGPTSSKPSPDRMDDSGFKFEQDEEIQQLGLDRALAAYAKAASIGPVSKPAASVGMSLGPSAANAATPEDAFESRLKESMIPDLSIPEPPSPFDEERILAIEDVPPERPTYPAGTYTSPYDRRVQDRLSVAGGTGILGISSPLAVNESTAGSLTPAQRDNLYRGAAAKTRSLSFSEDTIPRDENGDPIGPDTPSSDYVSDETAYPKNPIQDDYGDVQRPKGVLDKYGPKVPGLIGKVFSAKNWVEDKAWEKMSAEERLAQMDKWKQMNKDYLNRHGTDNDRGPEERAKFEEPKKKKKKVASASTTGTTGASRPQAYYNWDVGVNIPSPGDSDYTLYLKYLQEKAATT